MDIYEIRRLNLIALIRKRFNNNAADFARAVARSDSQVSQLKNGRNTKGGRAIGERQARKIEQTLGLTPGTLDLHNQIAPSDTAQQTAPQYAPSIDPGDLRQLLGAFQKLTRKQQLAFIGEVQAAASANEVIIREVGKRLCPPDDESVARHFPSVPVNKK